MTCFIYLMTHFSPSTPIYSIYLHNLVLYLEFYYDIFRKIEVYGIESFRISPGLNNIVPLRYAYSLGVRSSLQSWSKHDLRFCTAARFDGPCSVSSIWSWSRILRRKLVVGKSATSSVTRSCARPRTNSWTQWLLRSKN